MCVNEPTRSSDDEPPPQGRRGEALTRQAFTNIRHYCLAWAKRASCKQAGAGSAEAASGHVRREGGVRLLVVAEDTRLVGSNRLSTDPLLEEVRIEECEYIYICCLGCTGRSGLRMGDYHRAHEGGEDVLPHGSGEQEGVRLQDVLDSSVQRSWV